MVFMMLSAAATAATAYLIQPALDDIFISKNMNKLILIPVVVVIVFVVKGGSMYGQAILMNYVGESDNQIFQGQPVLKNAGTASFVLPGQKDRRVDVPNHK